MRFSTTCLAAVVAGITGCAAPEPVVAPSGTLSGRWMGITQCFPEEAPPGDPAFLELVLTLDVSGEDEARGAVAHLQLQDHKEWAFRGRIRDGHLEAGARWSPGGGVVPVSLDFDADSGRATGRVGMSYWCDIVLRKQGTSPRPPVVRPSRNPAGSWSGITECRLDEAPSGDARDGELLVAVEVLHAGDAQGTVAQSHPSDREEWRFQTRLRDRRLEARARSASGGSVVALDLEFDAARGRAIGRADMSRRCDIVLERQSAPSHAAQ